MRTVNTRAYYSCTSSYFIDDTAMQCCIKGKFLDNLLSRNCCKSQQYNSYQ